MVARKENKLVYMPLYAFAGFDVFWLSLPAGRVATNTTQYHRISLRLVCGSELCTVRCQSCRSDTWTL